MTFEWNRAAMDVMAVMVARSVAARALPVFQRAAGEIPIRLEGNQIVSGQDGLEAEYRDNKPWVFRGIAVLKGGV